MTKEEKLAQWLREAMYRKRLGIRETARLTKTDTQPALSHATVSDIANGKAVNASAETLNRLAKALDTPIEPVLRILGIYDPVSESDELDAKILNASRQMEPDIKEMYLKIAQGLLEDKQPKKNQLQTEQIS